MVALVGTSGEETHSGDGTALAPQAPEKRGSIQELRQRPQRRSKSLGGIRPYRGNNGSATIPFRATPAGRFALGVEERFGPHRVPVLHFVQDVVHT